jgi:hypothetical protein
VRALGVKVIHHRDHLGVSLWRGDRLIGGFCLLFTVFGQRPEDYPRFHAAFDWRGRLWSYFSRTP